MKFTPTDVDGALVVEIEPIEDERGFFARSWCAREFMAQGADVAFVQENVGYSTRAGTLRGMHFQRPPFDEVKLVRCTSGSVYDVAADLRPESPTYGRWAGVELTARRRNMLLVPAGCAHGYLSLEDRSELRYLTSQFFEPDAAWGVRFDDPTFAIQWPRGVEVISHRDRTWPLLAAGGAEGARE